jgi:hypothetical protein
MHVAQDADAEPPPDDAGHLQRQLLAGREAVDPRGHHALHGLREAHRAEGAGAGCDRAFPVGDADQPGVAQGVGQLLAEERVALGAFVDQGGHRLGQAADPEALAHQGHGLVPAQRLQLEPFGGRVLAEPPEVVRERIAHGPGGQHQQERPDLGAHLAGQRPGGRVEPVGVVQDQQEWPGAAAGPGRRGLEELLEQLAGIVGPHLAGQLGRQLVVGQLERQDAAEQRRQLGVRRHVGQHAPATLLDVLDADQPHQLGEHGPPGVVRRGLLDGDTRADQRRPGHDRAPARAGRPAAATCQSRAPPRSPRARRCRP